MAWITFGLVPDKGALRGKAQVVIDCAPEHAAAWLFDLNSCGRTRKAKEYNSQEDRIVVGNVDRDREVRLSEERMDEMGMIVLDGQGFGYTRA